MDFELSDLSEDRSSGYWFPIDEEGLWPEVLRLEWMYASLWQLAETAAAGIAVIYYMAALWFIPALPGLLAIFLYLAQGLYLMVREVRQTMEPEDRPKWRQMAIFVLGWPMHYTLLEFYTKVTISGDQDPTDIMDNQRIHALLKKAMLRWFCIWYAFYVLAIVIGGLIEPNSWFFWAVER